MPTTAERTTTRLPTPIKRPTEPTVELQTRVPEWAISIRGRAPMAGIPAFMSVALPEVWTVAERLGLRPVVPFARYHGFEAPGSEFGPPEIDLEAGVLVDGAAAHGEGRVEPIQLPGGEVAVATHVGPYRTLHETYAMVQRWITEHGRTSSRPMWEVYIDDPQLTPTDELRTEVVVPLD